MQSSGKFHPLTLQLAAIPFCGAAFPINPTFSDYQAPPSTSLIHDLSPQPSSTEPQPSIIANPNMNTAPSSPPTAKPSVRTPARKPPQSRPQSEYAGGAGSDDANSGLSDGAEGARTNTKPADADVHRALASGDKPCGYGGGYCVVG
ncbi:hypothetical protein EV122DRAFT_256259 [Schizophyllum commune]